MNLKWCAFTGALMMLFAVTTFMHLDSVHPIPGEKARWWDGTLISKDEHFSNGQLYAHTEFGDDGKTVNVHREWSEEGKLVSEEVRQKDGTIEENMYEPDGKTVSRYTLWLPDKMLFREQRDYYGGGRIMQEQIASEDGRQVQRRTNYEYNGKKQQEWQILPNADQQTDSYSNGQLRSRQFFRANADQEDLSFYDDGKTVRSRSVVIKLTGARLQESFYQDGKISYRMEQPDFANWTSSKFTREGVLRLRRTLKGRWISRIEEYSEQTGSPIRFTSLTNGLPSTVEKYRADGTLEAVKEIDTAGKVVVQRDYDAAGKEVIATKETGEPETFDRNLLTRYEFAD